LALSTTPFSGTASRPGPSIGYLLATASHAWRFPSRPPRRFPELYRSTPTDPTSIGAMRLVFAISRQGSLISECIHLSSSRAPRNYDLALRLMNSPAREQLGCLETPGQSVCNNKHVSGVIRAWYFLAEISFSLVAAPFCSDRVRHRNRRYPDSPPNTGRMGTNISIFIWDTKKRQEPMHPTDQTRLECNTYRSTREYSCERNSAVNEREGQDYTGPVGVGWGHIRKK
jgi:hypothetical protein